MSMSNPTAISGWYVTDSSYGHVHITIVEATPAVHRWVCSCGSVGQWTTFDVYHVEDNARRHVRRAHGAS